MPNWKEMYLTLMRDTEKAIRILEESQRKCEELYIESSEPDNTPSSSQTADGTVPAEP